jgi:replication factor C subunit 3/5
MFLPDKYNPKKLQDLFFHLDILQKLAQISRNNDIPHIIFHGPPESGKKTLIHFFLEMLFDSTVHKTRLETYTVSGASSNNETEIELKQSNYHIVIEPNNNNFDKHLIQNVIKEYARVEPLNVFKTYRPFKIVLINNIDNLSYHAQTSLRRTMETYSKTCRFIMWCCTLSKIIQPVRSRCYCVRVPYPSDDDLRKYLIHISALESIPLTLQETDAIIKTSQGQIKKAIWQISLKEHKIKNPKTSYDDIIDEITRLIFEPNLRNIVLIRDLLYNMMITTIPGSQIIKSLLESFLEKVKDDEKKFKLIETATLCEHRLLLGRRDINHLGLFIINLFEIVHRGNKKWDKAKIRTKASKTSFGVAKVGKKIEEVTTI